MKLVMTLLVRDEEDILEANINFHLAQGVDFIIATDNCSVDDTPDILRRYQRRGVLHYIYQPADDYMQGQWVTEMARLAAQEFGADWVINNDADEFWYPETGSLKVALSEVPNAFDAAVVPRANFVPRQLTKGEFFADSMTIRESRSLNALGGPLPPKVCHRGHSDIEVGQGNHCVSLPDRQVTLSPVPITIFHFPMRSYAQFSNKIALGGAAYARNSTLPASTGATWRFLYELWKKGELETYYENSILDQESVSKGLADGSLLTDERLKLALTRLRDRRETR